MQFEQAVQFIMSKLRNELPANLSYHTIEHVQDVYDAAARIGQQENINAYEMQLLLTAASYHDAGFLVQPAGHEEESCHIAKQILPAYQYTTNEIDQICALIMTTKLPQSPQNHLEEILADADLDYLGRDDYFPISHKLYEEMLVTGVLSTKEQWKQVQINFMQSHHYFTATCINLRNAKKEENLRQIISTS